MLHPFVMAFATCVATAHGITIDAAPDQVWPWIAQMGAVVGSGTRCSPSNRSAFHSGWTTPEGGRLMTWAFVLEEAAHDSTRLIVRARVGRGARVFGLPWWAAKYLVSAIHFPMQRKQLIGIARRAELTISRSSVLKTADRQAASAR